MVRIPGINALCREYLVLDILKRLRPGYFLEIGSGDGALLRRAARYGLRGKGIDLSPEAIRRSKDLCSGIAQQITLECADLFDVSGTFDLVLMLQVLEHIEDDRKALLTVKKILAPQGYLLLSVPAHKNKWGYIDRVGGHYRRYDKEELCKLLSETGFTSISFFSLGVPLVNWLRWWDERLYQSYFQKKGMEKLSLAEKTQLSGYCDVPWVLAFPFWMKLLLNDFFLYPFLLMQKLFMRSDAGLNYLVLARLP